MAIKYTIKKKEQQPVRTNHQDSKGESKSGCKQRSDRDIHPF